MVYVVSVLIVCLSGFVGKKMAAVYVFRDKFFKEFNSLLVYFENNIRYSQTKIDEMFDCYSVDSRAFKKIKELKNLATEGVVERKRQLFLKLEEQKEIGEFFKSFGNGNLETELNKIKNLKSFLERRGVEAEEQRKKNEGLIYKLSLMIGVVICILIL